MAGILNIQFTPKAGDKEASLKKVEDFISGYCDKELDLIVVPEFFSTSIDDYTMINAPEDENGGIVIDFLKKVAKKYHTNIICGSVMEKCGEKLYNTCFVLDRDGEIVGKYRKIHLFNYFGGNEGTYTEAGEKPLVVELDFALVGVSLCFDIKFPMLYRELIKRGAEIIVSPSAWSIPKKVSDKEKEVCINTWQAMNICRATENLVYFITSNLVGNTNPFCESIGNSMIVGPMGEVIKNLGTQETAAYADLDMSVIYNFKKTVPVAMID